MSSEATAPGGRGPLSQYSNQLADVVGHTGGEHAFDLVRAAYDGEHNTQVVRDRYLQREQCSLTPGPLPVEFGVTADDTRLAAAAARSEHLASLACDLPRLTDPDGHNRRTAVLLRHSDLVAPVANLHSQRLLDRLDGDPAEAA
ncbi:hypothetical protein ABZ863_22655 [Saccharomonospora sp. NPDC046836]|uniref:hypothetical protein n=1 Tax=Saccharomonospora sp. NPDC046836 TaxID=3156921 RepID=UPI0033EEB46B